MKKSVLLLMLGLLTISCNNKKNEAKTESQDVTAQEPKGSWKVNKEFDKDGNLVGYDSIYTWSSNNKWDDLKPSEKDSLLNAFESKFYNQFSHFENDGFENVFSQDSLFSKHFFNRDFFKSEFGIDLMSIDKAEQQILERQKQFLEKYQSEFFKPKTDNN